MPVMNQPYHATGSIAAITLAVLLSAAAVAEPELRRASLWDLKIGEPIAAQPAPVEFRGFACGANGGPPRQPLAGWRDFARCPAEPNGLHEVSFEYDDEYEYIARARDLEREISRWSGTTEAGFPILPSALFDRSGILRGLRIVTDPRPDYRSDITEAETRKRAEAYVLGSILSARFDIEPGRYCRALPPAEGEGPVGDVLIKQVCEKTDQTRNRRFVLRVNYFRKPGQSGTNPQLPTQLTRGQFESSARLEILGLDPR
jgi:hypothetical protein